MKHVRYGSIQFPEKVNQYSGLRKEKDMHG